MQPPNTAVDLMHRKRLMMMAAQPGVGWYFRHSCVVRSALASIMAPNMNATFTAVVKQRGDWWIGWIEEVPGVNAQERTKTELLKSLREALLEALEFNREEARRAAEGEYVEEPVMV
jgi:predicted RNase H-like HicB family nuclease